MLGPLEVWQGERKLRLGGVKQRSLLGLLLLEAGSVVSSERLIEELWGSDQPEDAPTALQQHVSRLRKLLEPYGALETRPPGYVLAIEPDELDLRRFERLCDDGRGLLAEGRAEDAASVLRAALEVWRGEPFADLAGEPLLLTVRPRLEEARLEALEARIDADLAGGRDRELVGELRELVRRHPLRERFRGQLMTALYRAGRQAEALEVYADARRTLVDELGLEPGPELQRLQQAILAHDAGLAAQRRPLASRRRRRLLPAALVLGAVLAGAAVALALVGGGESRRTGPATAAPGQGAVLALDSRSGSLRRRIDVGRTPSAIAAHAGAVWVVDGDAQTVIRLTESSRVVETFSTGATPTDVAAGGDLVWVAEGRPLAGAQFVGPVTTAVTPLDATTGTKQADEVPLPRRGGAVSNLVENHLAVRGDAVWAVTPDYRVVRIDGATGAITARSSAVRAAAVATGPAGVWVLGVDGAVARLNERTARPIGRTRLPGSPAGSIAVGDDAAWVTSPDGTLWKIGVGSPPTIGEIDLGRRGAADVAVATGAIWVANPLAGTVVRVDPATGNVGRPIDLNGIPRSIAVDGDTLWVALVADPAQEPVELAGIRPFAPPTCGRVRTGRGGADLLLVSDLPLQGGARLATPQMVQAVTFVLREHGFRAGRFRLAYQSCDDSVARTGIFDEAKCAANARAYAASQDVIAVIGPLNSSCAVAAVPELNRAPGGPLPIVSPLSSFVGLTRAGPGIDPALPAALYPTGRRNYLRVCPTDDLQGAALALFARDRGRRRVYVLDDGQPGYGALMATGFETAARRLGLDVAGRATWDPGARGYAALARRVARSKPDAVFVGGLLDSNAAGVVRDLRARLGPHVDLLGPDGLTPLPLLVRRAGRAAVGVHVSLGGTVAERLPRAGARFAQRFATQVGGPVEPFAVYAAQATEVVLDAIARSDGTRESVLDALFATRVEDGLLGSFGFNADGDVTESPIAIVRVARAGGSNRVGSVEGGVVERIVHASPSLVGESGPAAGS